MNHFFVREEAVGSDSILIDSPEDLKHILQVLRLKGGDMITVSTGDGKREYLCRIGDIDKERLYARIEDLTEPARELPAEITLFQGIPKGEKMEWIIQKAVELGAVRIVPVNTRRSVVRLTDKRGEKKKARWQEIAKSAAKQSKRSRIPLVSRVMSFDEALEEAGQLNLILFPYEDARGMAEARRTIAGAKNAGSIGIFIGPEGGFDPEEADRALKAGARILTLGHRILRTETAGMMVLSLLSFTLEED